METLTIHHSLSPPLGKQPMEYVERKGIGHPDTICDSVMEQISVKLSGAYLERAGRVLHHNIDKGLLVAGHSIPKLGGGLVDAPMRLVVGDRATFQCNGDSIPVDEIVDTTARAWLKNHLRLVNPDVHLIIQNELRSGSVELSGIFASERSRQPSDHLANDTSAAVGFAPLTETEHMVLAAEHFLNSEDFKHEFPETGEDVKVMGVRHGRELDLTIAVAFIDHYIWEVETYFHRKAAVEFRLHEFLNTKLHELDRIKIHINTLDDESRGLDGMYLTVLGTSAESGDGGQVGRGNRTNGLISLNRPMTLEAAAGKNPVSHVGKVYNVLAHQIASAIYESSDAIEEAYVWLCSQIGNPISRPWFASVQLSLAEDVALSEVEQTVYETISRELGNIGAFTEQLVRGELSVC